jgi:hypothetical protein
MTTPCGRKAPMVALAAGPDGGLASLQRIQTMLGNPYRWLVYLVSVWVLGLTLCGCATRGAVQRGAQTLGRPPAEATNNGFWWACRFKVVWPPDQEPDLAVDLLLAHAVVRPVLRQYENRILYWRFHRRAARDQSGHRFSFLFYTDPATAAEVFKKIEESKPLGDALAARIVEELITDDPAKPAKPNVADLSDPNWSPTLQRNWPAFIMGVSALWLGLVDEAMAEIPGDSSEIGATLERCRKADARITAVWNKEGQHAFLHHLSALFGYKPILIRKELTF